MIPVSSAIESLKEWNIKKLSESERARIGRILLAKQQDLHAGIRATEHEIDGVREARADGLADDEHDPEGSTLSADWSRLQGLAIGLSGSLAETNDAIDRLDSGGWGSCESCGQDIAAARLEARPSAAFCLQCASMKTR